MKTQFKTLLESKDLKNISVEIAEKVIDNEISNEIIKEVPILKLVLAAKTIYSSYTDKIFIKKALKVLLEIGEVNSEDRLRFSSELDDEDEKGIDKILMAIDKLETLEKCKIFGRLCKLRADSKIEIDIFLRLTKVIQDAYLDDIYLIKKFKKTIEYELDEEEYYPLLNLGLIYRDTPIQIPIARNYQMYSDDDSEFTGGKIEFKYKLSFLGGELLQHYNSLFY